MNIYPHLSYLRQAGCDLDCGNTYQKSNLMSALSSNLMTEDDLNLALTRVYTMRFNLGMFEPASKACVCVCVYVCVCMGKGNAIKGIRFRHQRHVCMAEGIDVRASV